MEKLFYLILLVSTLRACPSQYNVLTITNVSRSPSGCMHTRGAQASASPFRRGRVACCTMAGPWMSVDTGYSLPNSLCIEAIRLTARKEYPPSSKKSSCTPTSGASSSSDQIPASFISTRSRGATSPNPGGAVGFTLGRQGVEIDLAGEGAAAGTP